MSLQGTFLQYKTNKRRWAEMLTVFSFRVAKNYTAYNKEERVLEKSIFFPKLSGLCEDYVILCCATGGNKNERNKRTVARKYHSPRG